MNSNENDLADFDARNLSQIDAKAFNEAIVNEDALGAVIKAAIFIENQLIALLEENLPQPAALKDLQLDYFGRVGLAVAAGLDERFSRPLRALGTIRNKFAHRLDAQLSDQVVDHFYDTFSPEDKQVIQQSYGNTRRKMPSAHEARLKSKPAKDRFAIYVATLRAALLVARQQGARGVKSR